MKFFRSQFSVHNLTFGGKVFSYVILAILLGAISVASVALSAAPSGGYSPGEELDPDCAPDDVDCTVRSITINSSGHVGIGDNTPDYYFESVATSTNEVFRAEGYPHDTDTAVFSAIEIGTDVYGTDAGYGINSQGSLIVSADGSEINSVFVGDLNGIGSGTNEEQANATYIGLFDSSSFLRNDITFYETATSPTTEFRVKNAAGSLASTIKFDLVQGLQINGPNVESTTDAFVVRDSTGSGLLTVNNAGGFSSLLNASGVSFDITTSKIDFSAHYDQSVVVGDREGSDTVDEALLVRRSSETVTDDVYGLKIENNVALDSGTDGKSRFGVYIDAPSSSFEGSSGAETSDYGLFIKSPFSTSSDKSYGFVTSRESDVNNGIGTITPEYVLDVFEDSPGDHVARFRHQGDDEDRSGIIIQSGQHVADTSNEYISFRDGDGTEVGECTYNGTTFSCAAPSDIRLKKNITDTNLSLDDLLEIQVRDFQWKESVSGSKEIVHGFIAQELNEAYPQAVFTSENEDEYWKVAPEQLVPLLVKSVQELESRVRVLEAKLQ